ncbi:MAG: dienelactone hydrolase family protein [Pirellulaceae bacterium]|nr:dienelactone hydrolase family protein [Pirellulaceae bacterium]
MRTLTCWVAVVAAVVSWSETALAQVPAIKRVLPPEGMEIPKEEQEKLETRIEKIREMALAKEKQASFKLSVDQDADIEIFLLAVEFALEFREFYDPKDLAKATALLDEAEKRVKAVAKEKSPWVNGKTGLIVAGYTPELSPDETPQPYGLVIPAGHDFGKPCPLYVWLHGRGDKQTNLHFIHERMRSQGQIAPPGAIVLHPFGRQCVGFKFAGETDITEAILDVTNRYNIDAHRIVLMGFSMGGAGAWHYGAHNAFDFCAVSPGAGFAETARYRKLKREDFPPWYEQKLWGLYDVPCYTRNLFNLPTIAYSGENDKQIQAARVMEEAFIAEGHKLEHLIGPGVEHKYEPKTLEKLLERLDGIVKQQQPETPREVHLQTRTLAYPYMHWVNAERLTEHWLDSRIDAKLVGKSRIEVTTKNIAELSLFPYETMTGVEIVIDGDKLVIKNPLKTSEDGQPAAFLARSEGHWTELKQLKTRLRKNEFVHGPIDDAFTGNGRVVVVMPTGKSKHEKVAAWVKSESEHQLTRWRALMRGELTVKTDKEVLEELAEADDVPTTDNFLIWGDVDSNLLLAKWQQDLPVEWKENSWSLGGKSYDAATTVPVLIHPSPDDGTKYVVLNSGLTFREGHDGTNSNQTPKLPDWAAIDIAVPADANLPGRVVEAGFFDEEWRVKGK